MRLAHRGGPRASLAAGPRRGPYRKPNAHGFPRKVHRRFDAPSCNRIWAVGGPNSVPLEVSLGSRRLEKWEIQRSKGCGAWSECRSGECEEILQQEMGRCSCRSGWDASCCKAPACVLDYVPGIAEFGHWGLVGETRTCPLAEGKTAKAGAHPARRKSVPIGRLKENSLMFCCKCGGRNPDDASYCHSCGILLYKGDDPKVERSPRKPTAHEVETLPDEEQRRLIDELLPIGQKPHECHACGRKDNLYGWDFGLGKPISTKRAWGETAASIAVSAVSLALGGPGLVHLPGKKTRLRVLRLRLILCDSCRRRQISYTLHPWWEPARRLGYTEFLSADDMEKLQPAP